MKQITAILLAICVAFSGIGLTFSQHFCHGNLVKSTVSLTQAVANCETPSELAIKMNCCQTKIQWIQSDDLALQSLGFSMPALNVTILPLGSGFDAWQFPAMSVSGLILARAPPSGQRPIWMKLSVFLS